MVSLKISKCNAWFLVWQKALMVVVGTGYLFFRILICLFFFLTNFRNCPHLFVLSAVCIYFLLSESSSYWEFSIWRSEVFYWENKGQCRLFSKWLRSLLNFFCSIFEWKIFFTWSKIYCLKYQKYLNIVIKKFISWKWMSLNFVMTGEQ